MLGEGRENVRNKIMKSKIKRIRMGIVKNTKGYKVEVRESE